MGVATNGEDTVVVRAPRRVRATGAWMLVLACFGVPITVLAAASVVDGQVAAILPLAFTVAWTVWLSRCALRLRRLSVVADGAGLTVHNQFRTHVVAWPEVADISFVQHRGRLLYRLVLLGWRWTAVVRLVDGSEVEVDATETFWASFTGRLFSGSVAAARARTEVLQAARHRFTA